MLTVAEAVAAVTRAATGLLSPSEFVELNISIADTPDPVTNHDDDLVRSDWQLRISVLGEACRIWLDPDETSARLYERARSDLQDFVAESRFGWGQRRI